MDMRSSETDEQYLEFAADSPPQFICLLDREGCVIRANHTVECWKLGIDILEVGGFCLHDALHRACGNPHCYLRRFWERAAIALAKGQHANCDAWDPILKRHFLIRARRPILTQQRENAQDSLSEVFAVVTVDDVTQFKTIEKKSEKLTRALKQRVEHEQGMRTQAELFHSHIIDALDNTPNFFAMADACGKLNYLNPAGWTLLGLESQEEAYGMSLLECHAPGVREHLKKTAMPAAARDGSWSGESVLLTRNGREIRTTLVIIAHHGDEGKLVGFSVQERDMTEWVKAEEALRASQSEFRRLAARYLTIQETERWRIAADLHDGLGQSLTLIKIWIEVALGEMGAGVPPKVVKSVKKLIPVVQAALHEVRRVAMDLRPSILDDLGLLPTLSWFAREFQGTNMKIRIEKHISVSEKDVPEPLKLPIFRILQEAVNNAFKYSDADCIKVSLRNEDGVLVFTIEDNGKGFDPGALASRGDARSGLGMESMRERAELSGGTYALTSAVGQGTKVCASWPASRATEGDRDRTDSDKTINPGANVGRRQAAGRRVADRRKSLFEQLQVPVR
jgi:PAS domain S-box-containing protein